MRSTPERRNGMKRSWVYGVLLALVTAFSAAEGGPGKAPEKGTEGKKVIVFGEYFDPPFLSYFREHGNQTSISGVVVDFWTSAPGGWSERIANSLFDKVRFPPDQFDQQIQDLRSVREMFPDSLLRLNVAPGIDWFDDEIWEEVLDKAKLMARVVAEGKLRGYCLDTEQYAIGAYLYPVQLHAQTRSFQEYQAQVRQRGRQLMAVLASAKPDVTVLYTLGHTQASLELVGDLPLARTTYGLLPAFIDGMMEEGPRAEFFDGYERAYSYKTYSQFADGARHIREGGRKLSLVPQLYARKMKVGFGIWPPQGEDLGDEPLGFTPGDLEHALHYALRECDGLVWLYMGRTYSRWWERLPQEYLDAVAEAWKPHPLDHQPERTRESQPYSLQAREWGGDSVKDEVAFFHLKDTHTEVLDLPLTWKFKLDPDDVGRKQRWFRVGYEDTDWKTIQIREWWQPQGYLYNGVAWYRVTVEVPEIRSAKGLILAFGAVDEEAWVWVNGKPTGDHAFGPEGWQAPFEIDVAKLLRPGRPNQITVRVNDSAGVGGIWKGVKLMQPKARESQ